MVSILVLFLLVLTISFVCSLVEATFLSITPAYLAVETKERKAHAIILEHLKENVDRPIAAILTMNTIANSAGSALIGASIHQLYGNSAVTIFSIILTFTILIISEITPKSLGTKYWKTLAPFAAYSIQLMVFFLYPIVRISEKIGRSMKGPDTPDITREEMIASAELGVDEGILHRKESAIIKNLLMLNKLYVCDIMTPRSVFFALEAQMSVEEVHQKYQPIRFSRIPVYHGSLDNIIGMTMRHRIHEMMSNDRHTVKINEITTPIHQVSERMTVSGLIDLFVRRKEHLALAVDEYGVVTGLVTLEDAIETLLGVEIVDELDNITDMRQYALEQWQIRKNLIKEPNKRT